MFRIKNGLKGKYYQSTIIMLHLDCQSGSWLNRFMYDIVSSSPAFTLNYEKPCWNLHQSVGGWVSNVFGYCIYRTCSTISYIQHGWEYCNFRLEVPQNPVSSSKPLNPFQEDEEEMSAAVRLLVGIALVIVAEVFYHECNCTCSKNMHFQLRETSDNKVLLYQRIWQLLSIKENICAERPRKSYALQDAKI